MAARHNPFDQRPSHGWKSAAIGRRSRRIVRPRRGRQKAGVRGRCMGSGPGGGGKGGQAR
eukprot:364643-Chlamydomonas_euryale.AAC.4